jgi:cobalt-zinc-cadmium efflux system protein
MPQTRRLLMVLALNLGLVAALVVAGVTAHSLAVLAEGGDYLLDAAGVSVALLAIWLSARPAGGVRREGARARLTLPRSSTAAGCSYSRYSSPPQR